MALCAAALVVFRLRDRAKMPWGFGTLFFAAVSAAVVINSYVAFPRDTLIGMAILLSGAPVYFFWTRAKAKAKATTPHAADASAAALRR
jgi:hypothetical protein